MTWPVGMPRLTRQARPLSKQNSDPETLITVQAYVSMITQYLHVSSLEPIHLAVCLRSTTHVMSHPRRRRCLVHALPGHFADLAGASAVRALPAFMRLPRHLPELLIEGPLSKRRRRRSG